MRKKLDNISHGKPSAEQSSLKASQSSNGTKIRTDIEETKEKLSALAEKWKGVNSVKGFLTDLWIALGISIPSQGQHKGGNPSRYTAFKLKDGSVITVTIRASAHNADAANYSKEENVNGDRNLSLVLQKRWKKNKFKSSINVKLDEYVYVDSNIANIENPLTQIATALIGYLTNGIYVDTTGVAIVHKSPTTIKELNTRKIMNTNKIKLTESQLKQMISESVKKALNEIDWKTYANAAKANHRKYSGIYNPKKKTWYSFYDDGYKDYEKYARRTKAFQDAAKKAFDDEYGWEESHPVEGSDYYAGDVNYSYGYDTDGLPRVKYKVSNSGPMMPKKETKLTYNGCSYDKGQESDFYDDRYLKERPAHFDKQVCKKNKEKSIKGDEEIKNYRNGNYKYTNDKGWHLKESKLKSIVAEAVRDVLNS